MHPQTEHVCELYCSQTARITPPVAIGWLTFPVMPHQTVRRLLAIFAASALARTFWHRLNPRFRPKE
jgi:hypothetical protein